jgi:hypothetical protein
MERRRYQRWVVAVIRCTKSLFTHVTRLNCTTKIPLDMEQTKMQLELKPDTITIKVNMWQGVLTTKTFEGPDCYTQMLNFIKQEFPDDHFIHATIVLK